MHSVSHIPLVKRLNVFGLVTRERTFYLQAPSAQDMECWVREIRNAVQKAFPNDERWLVSPLASPITGQPPNIDAFSRQASIASSAAKKLSTIESADSKTQDVPSLVLGRSSIEAKSTIEASPTSSPVTTALQEALSQTTPAVPLPLPKSVQELATRSSITNPSPLSKSWNDEGVMDTGINSDSEEEESSSPVANTNPSATWPVQDNIVHAQAYLFRLKTGLGGAKTWKRQWFVIRNGKLTSYKSDSVCV